MKSLMTITFAAALATACVGNPTPEAFCDDHCSDWAEVSSSLECVTEGDCYNSCVNRQNDRLVLDLEYHFASHGNQCRDGYRVVLSNGPEGRSFQLYGPGTL